MASADRKQNIVSALYKHLSMLSLDPISLSNSDRKKLPHLLRWMDYIQTKGDVGETFQKVLLEKVSFAPPGSKGVKKAEVESNAIKTEPETKQASSSDVDSKK